LNVCNTQDSTPVMGQSDTALTHTHRTLHQHWGSLILLSHTHTLSHTNTHTRSGQNKVEGALTGILMNCTMRSRKVHYLNHCPRLCGKVFVCVCGCVCMCGNECVCVCVCVR